MNNTTLNIIYSVLIVVLLVISAFCSSADMAYGSVSVLRLENHDVPKDAKKVKIALKLVKNYDYTISTILFVNDLVNVAAQTIATLLAYSLFTSNGMNGATGSLVGSFSMLIIIIIFGEIVPKSLTRNKAFEMSLKYAYLTRFICIICTPISFLTNCFGKLVMIPIKKSKIEKPDVTDEELEEMVDVIEKEGVVDKDNADILRGTIDYASTEAYEIMTPRVDLVAIDIEDSLDKILKTEDLFIHSRIPVYEETIDNIIGFVTIKDLIRLKLSKQKDSSVRSILREPLRFPRSTEINDILQDFKKTKIHFAIVLDEYGGVEGIITMEDILEEIVGEIWDEADDVDEPVHEIGDNAFIIDGNMNLSDFFEMFDIDPDEIETDYVTIGGYCIELLDDRFAKVNDVINFKNLTMTVIAVDENNTIEKLKVIRKVEEED